MSSRKPSDRWGVVLLVCAVVVALWIGISARNRHPVGQQHLKPDDFAELRLSLPGWTARRLPIQGDPLEPNIAAFRLKPESVTMLREDDGISGLTVRLVHGYNMPDCMRIKQYAVELVCDLRDRSGESQHVRLLTNVVQEARGTVCPVQVWRVTSKGGSVSTWMTTMLRASDFATTDVDVRSMPFPRVGTPDDPSWNPRGISLSGLRHPWRSLRQALRAKWNKSRKDILVFFGLRRPAWVSDRHLAFVCVVRGDPLLGEGGLLDDAILKHCTMIDQVQTWVSESGILLSKGDTGRPGLSK